MNCKVVYCTLSGHSRKISNAIAEKLDAVAYNVKNENCEVMNEDLLVIVSGIYSGLIAPELKSWLENLDGSQVKNAAIVMSSVSQNYDRAEIKAILQKKNINIAGEHTCYGSFLIMKFGHPKKDEIASAVDFADKIYNTVTNK